MFANQKIFSKQKLFFLCLLLAFSKVVLADEFQRHNPSRPHSLLDLRFEDWQLSVAPSMKFTRLARSNVTLTGLKVNMLAHRAFSLGLAGYQLSNELYADSKYPREADFRYGGLHFESIRSRSLLNWTMYSLIGAAQAIAKETTVEPNQTISKKEYMAFAMELGFGFYIRVIDNFHTGFLWGYRWSAFPKNEDISSGNFSGSTGTVAFEIEFF